MCSYSEISACGRPRPWSRPRRLGLVVLATTSAAVVASALWPRFNITVSLSVSVRFKPVMPAVFSDWSVVNMLLLQFLFNQPTLPKLSSLVIYFRPDHRTISPQGNRVYDHCRVNRSTGGLPLPSLSSGWVSSDWSVQQSNVYLHRVARKTDLPIMIQCSLRISQHCAKLCVYPAKCKV